METHYAFVCSILGFLTALALASTHQIAGGSDALSVSEIQPKNNDGLGNKSDIQPKQNCVCGTRQSKKSDMEDKIVGGVEADVNEFPWRCNLQYKNSQGRLSFFCGCSVISNSHILTAAHCTNAVKGRQIYVDMGDHNLASSSESESQVVTVKKVNQHPQYNPQTYDNDISVLELSSAVTFNKYISPVCFPYKFGKSEQFGSKTVTASGWGTEKEGARSTPDILRKVDLPVLTTAQCRKYMRVTDNMICTYQQGTDTCQGDSGGSIDLLDANGKYYAIGITSFGEGCARKDKPGAYCKTNQYMDFVDQTTGGAVCKA